MKHEEENYLLFSSRMERKSRYTVAREVYRAIRRTESLSGLTYTPKQKRRQVRHEVLHHIPLENDEMFVEGGIRKQNDGATESTYGWVAVCHPMTKNFKYFLSLFTPLLDRRFKQTLSDGDRERMIDYVRQFVTRKKKPHRR